MSGRPLFSWLQRRPLHSAPCGRCIAAVTAAAVQLADAPQDVDAPQYLLRVPRSPAAAFAHRHAGSNIWRRRSRTRQPGNPEPQSQGCGCSPRAVCDSGADTRLSRPGAARRNGCDVAGWRSLARARSKARAWPDADAPPGRFVILARTPGSHALAPPAGTDAMAQDGEAVLVRARKARAWPDADAPPGRFVILARTPGSHALAPPAGTDAMAQDGEAVLVRARRHEHGLRIIGRRRGRRQRPSMPCSFPWACPPRAAPQGSRQHHPLPVARPQISAVHSPRPASSRSTRTRPPARTRKPAPSGVRHRAITCFTSRLAPSSRIRTGRSSALPPA